jgi:hypothetical protein
MIGWNGIDTVFRGGLVAVYSFFLFLFFFIFYFASSVCF